jgi:hypothetical protein
LAGKARIDIHGRGGEWITGIAHGDTAVFRYVKNTDGFIKVVIEAEGTGIVEVYLDERKVADVVIGAGNSPLHEAACAEPAPGTKELKLRFFRPRGLKIMSVTLLSEM